MTKNYFDTDLKYKLPPLILIVLFIVFAGLALIMSDNGYDRRVNDPKLCQNCHQMKSFIISWNDSSHSKIGCLTCHGQVALGGYIYRERVGAVTAVVNKDFIPDEVCRSCHSKQRRITPPGGLIIPHNLHSQKGVDCIDCHVTAGHYRSLATPNDNRVRMSQCLRCHNGAKASKTCATCHLKNT